MTDYIAIVREEAAFCEEQGRTQCARDLREAADYFSGHTPAGHAQDSARLDYLEKMSDRLILAITDTGEFAEVVNGVGVHPVLGRGKDLREAIDKARAASASPATTESREGSDANA